MLRITSLKASRLLKPSFMRLLSTSAVKTIKLDGKQYEAKEGQTVLDIARQHNIYIPTLCHHPRLGKSGSCRLCLVDVRQPNGDFKLMPACKTTPTLGMDIQTNNARVQENVVAQLSFLRADHPNACMNCDVCGNCEFQSLLFRYGISDTCGQKVRPLNTADKDTSTYALEREMAKCVKCGRCVQACSDMQGMDVLGFANRGISTVPTTTNNTPLNFTACMECGQCAAVCPTGAITERNEMKYVMNHLRSKEKILVVQTAPAVRVAIGEELNMAPGSIMTGQMVAALKALGFDYVVDTNFGADLTIMEEGSELLQRLAKGGPFPMFTSCCPGWVNMAEKLYPELLPNLSTARSPQAMVASLTKTYFADKLGVKRDQIVMVSVMPCTAKKGEAKRFAVDGNLDIDYLITTRELGHMLRLNRISLPTLKPQAYDAPLGLSTGAAELFGATGGVMEAAVRTAYEIATGKPLPKLVMSDIRGLAGVKSSVVEMVTKDGKKVNLRIAVANGGANTRALLEKMKRKEVEYDFVEIMACPGGCIGGGGQPRSLDKDVLRKRMEAVYTIDERSTIRKSHENPAIAQVYKEFLGEPLSHKSHELLHTHYTDRSKSIQQ